jgi:hypothetical protein
MAGAAVASRFAGTELRNAAGRHRGSWCSDRADHRQYNGETGSASGDPSQCGTAADAGALVPADQLNLSEVVQRQLHRRRIKTRMHSDLVKIASAVTGLPDRSPNGVQRVRAVAQGVLNKQLIPDAVDDQIAAPRQRPSPHHQPLAFAVNLLAAER